MKGKTGLDTVTVLLEAKRDLVYSSLSLVWLPIVYYFRVRNDNPIKAILETEEIPYDLIFLIGASEAIKLFVAFFFYPYNNIAEFGRSLDGPSRPHRSLHSKRESASKTISVKPMELVKGAANFVGAFLLCHAMLILFGAPFIRVWMLTFQFSMILVFWLLSPLCLVIRPSMLLTELVYISAWSGENSALIRGKWRFLALLLGTWMGAVVMPLDWDRPWQKWPVPCLVSATATRTLVDCLYFLYLAFVLYNPRWKNYFSSKESHSSKVKYY